MHNLLQCNYINAYSCNGHYQLYLLPLAGSLLLFTLYLIAAARQSLSVKRWRPWRTLSFTFGCACLAVSFSPSPVDFAHHSFIGHTIQHLLLGMLAPVGLVLGAPVTLMLRTVSLKNAQAISRLLGSRYFRLIGHPAAVLVLNAGSLFLLYLTPVFRLAHQSPLLHLLVHVHMLLAGYLFTWTVIGPDPAPGRLKMNMRMLILFITIAAHAFLSKYMYAYVYPKTEAYSTEEIRAGARLMYYGGDAVEFLVIILLFTLWYRHKGKPYYRFNFMHKLGN